MDVAATHPGGRVLVVADRVVVAIGLQTALSGRSWDVESISGRSVLDVVAHAHRFNPQCVLFDIHLGGGVGSGIELVGPLSATGAHVLLLTSERRRTVLAACLEAGAAGWIGTSAPLDEVAITVGHVLSGGSVIGRGERAALLDELRIERARTLRAHAIFGRLTQREALVLGALLDGLSADEIAESHFVALTTVRSQIRAVLQKLEVRSQLAAVSLASTHREQLPHLLPKQNDRRRTRSRVA